MDVLQIRLLAIHKVEHAQIKDFVFAIYFILVMIVIHVIDIKKKFRIT